MTSKFPFLRPASGSRAHTFLFVPAGVLAGAVVLAGCGSSSSGHDMGSMSGSSSSSSSAAAGAAGSSPSTSTGTSTTHNDADVTFATNMIQHHAQAIAMADLAATKASSDRVKQLATAIKAAQGPEIKTMSAWLTGWGKPVPDTSMAAMGHDMSGMSGSMPGMMTSKEMEQLAAASGTAFDRLWLTMMIRHHQGAVATAKTQLSSGSNADAKSLAQQVITTQQQEITTMQGLLAKA